MGYRSVAADVRRFVRFRAAELLYYSGALSVRRALRTRLLRQDQVCVLGFHRVLSPEEFRSSDSLAGMMMKERTFAELLAYAQEHFQVIGLNELSSAGESFAKPRCLLTFDDGWRDNYTRAYPWLRKYNLPAVIFLTAGFVGGGACLWVEQLSRAWKDAAIQPGLRPAVETLLKTGDIRPSLENLIEYLKHMSGEARLSLLRRLLPAGIQGNHRSAVDEMVNWDEVVEMSGSGIDFGAHTLTHPLLPYEDELTIEAELRQPKEILEERLGRKITAFAYPNGDWNEGIRRRVQETGYGYAFTTQAGWYRAGEDPYTICRVLLHEGNVTGSDGRFSPAMFNLTLARPS
jgi:peptidoglycan/xylan/chitin deacetylase (PgdA/CDA1 family)